MLVNNDELTVLDLLIQWPVAVTIVGVTALVLYRRALRDLVTGEQSSASTSATD